jgi:predicted TPR repeat methyltransferase
MTMSAPAAAFDAVADRYERELQKGLEVSGETPEHFAERRVQWLAGRLQRMNASPRRVLDFGCGTGGSSMLLGDSLEAGSILGVDISTASLEVARQRHGDPRMCFTTPGGMADQPPCDLAFCNGVFHHIPPVERAATLASIRNTLNPGGLFAFFENNPWNPGTRWVMSRISFDHDAVTIAASAARRMLADAGFEVISTDFLFIFPRWLGCFRPVERFVSGLPLGAQYLLLGRRT